MGLSKFCENKFFRDLSPFLQKLQMSVPVEGTVKHEYEFALLYIILSVNSSTGTMLQLASISQIKKLLVAKGHPHAEVLSEMLLRNNFEILTN